ncbi:hypothetical protein A5787_14240 [Mycobacterium sp. 852002-50816_SCH5313054-b]|uniref:hypothetical protein n=1 Tax=Mycobacterium sp. 852002-50816_SCH5313054-b TaxID=1834092 RepID=UPI0007FD3B06|nr:hypothetical protein [Mycobacterium sp. 852002-50816_SCH5313054-b]OBF43909.1 hypothetical protein A5787_14240 [Mycobacterium sp. 852002-50816_SCH5313054-b]
MDVAMSGDTWARAAASAPHTEGDTQIGTARGDLEALAAQLGDSHRVEHDDDDCLWVVRTSSDGQSVPVACMPAAKRLESGEPARSDMS